MRWSFLLLLCALLPITAVAQQTELSLTFGGNFTVSPKGTRFCEALPSCPTTPVSVDVDPGFAIGGSFARRFADFKAASLYAEFPVLGTPARSGPGFFNSDFSSIFFTPSIRAQLAPGASVSPFVSAGAGLAHYSGQGSDTQWGFQFGGGVDFKTRLPHLGLRLEVRDFITGRPSILQLVDVTSGHLQQLFAGGGLVIKF
jgi:Outer membrane protein beta-barrel domain